MPGAEVLGQELGGGQRRVVAPTRLRLGAAVHQRAQQRMGERGARAIDLEERVALGIQQRASPGTEVLERREQHAGVVGDAGRDQLEGGERRRRQLREPVGEAPLDELADGERPIEGRAAQSGLSANGLDDRQRVPGRCRGEAGHVGGRWGVAEVRRCERAHGAVVERTEQVRRGLDAGQQRAGAPRDQEHDRIVREAAGGERQRARRRFVEPVEIVDDEQHRARRLCDAQQRHRRPIDGERHRRGGMGEAERTTQRIALSLRERAKVLQHGTEQLLQPAERQLGLPVDPAAGEHEEVARLQAGGAKEGGLATARFPDERERAPQPGASAREGARDELQFGVTTDDRDPAMGRRRRHHLCTLEGRSRDSPDAAPSRSRQSGQRHEGAPRGRGTLGRLHLLSKAPSRVIRRACAASPSPPTPRRRAGGRPPA